MQDMNDYRVLVRIVRSFQFDLFRLISSERYHIARSDLCQMRYRYPWLPLVYVVLLAACPENGDMRYNTPRPIKHKNIMLTIKYWI